MTAPAAGLDSSAAVTRSLLGWGVVAGPFYVVVGLVLALTRPGFDLGRHALSLIALGDLGWSRVRRPWLRCHRRGVRRARRVVAQYRRPALRHGLLRARRSGRPRVLLRSSARNVARGDHTAVAGRPRTVRLAGPCQCTGLPVVSPPAVRAALTSAAGDRKWGRFHARSGPSAEPSPIWSRPVSNGPDPLRVR